MQRITADKIDAPKRFASAGGVDLRTRPTVHDAAAQACGLARGLVKARPWATVLVAASTARVLVANDAALSLMGARDGWCLGAAGDFRHTDRTTTSDLHARVRQLGSAAPGAPTRVAYFIEQPDGQQILVTMSRIETDDRAPATDAASGTPQDAAVLITLMQGQRREMRHGCDLLIETFDLTPAEARVAMSLLEGASLQTYSQQARIRISTVRWHLRNALAKTGCANQRELVRLLIALLDT